MMKFVSDTEGATTLLPSAETGKGTWVKNQSQEFGSEMQNLSIEWGTK